MDRSALNIDFIKENLKTNQVAHVQNLFPAAEVESVRQLLQQLAQGRSAGTRDCSSTNTGESPANSVVAKVRDKNGLISELERACKLDASFMKTDVFVTCHQLANEYYGHPCHYGFDHAIFKESGSGPVHWHQDQHYSRFDLQKDCLSFWIPLQEVSSDNGGMEYATGRYPLLRHTPISEGAYTHHVSDADRPKVDTISPNMQLGDACIHTALSLHRSHPNNSITTRGAWILQFNRFGYSRFFQWSNLRLHIERLRPGKIDQRLEVKTSK